MKNKQQIRGEGMGKEGGKIKIVIAKSIDLIIENNNI